MSDEPRKRSRFDQEETRDPRRSRFDRRSRSPSNRDIDDSKRERSPVGGSVESPSSAGKIDPSAAALAAAAAAARINAQIQARKAIQTVDVPPIRSVRPPNCSAIHSYTDASKAQSPSVTASNNTPGGEQSHEVYQQDGDYIKDIEVNDLRNRYTLTKGSTQKMVNTHLSAH